MSNAQRCGSVMAERGRWIKAHLKLGVEGYVCVVCLLRPARLWTLAQPDRYHDCFLVAEGGFVGSNAIKWLC